MMNSQRIINELKRMFPDARCELNYRNNFELLVAVVLSAQTTDQKVNAVTTELFNSYQTAFDLAEASQDQVASIIKTLGLSNTKSKNLVSLAQVLVAEYQGEVPNTFSALTKLPGVGRKTANVVLLEAFKIPAVPVDTHVERVSKRLGLVDASANVLQVEETLMKLIPKKDWIDSHQLFIHFGRYFCKAIKPQCGQCPFRKTCQKKELHI